MKIRQIEPLHTRIILFLAVFLLSACNHFSTNKIAHQAVLQQDNNWKIGAKIHFEEESRSDYIGLKKINTITKEALNSTLNIKKDLGDNNAKILLKKENDEIIISHYTEKMRPNLGEEMHSTLLYTNPRGFCQSETLKQVCVHLFDDCTKPIPIKEVANRYNLIIKSDWRFKISKIIAHKNENSTTFIAQLLLNDKDNLYLKNNSISAGLHMTLIQCFDNSILNDVIINKILSFLNQQLNGKMIKIATRNGIADLEFGISGNPWRIRAGQKIELKK